MKLWMKIVGVSLVLVCGSVAMAAPTEVTLKNIDRQIDLLQKKKEQLQRQYQANMVRNHRIVAYPPPWAVPYEPESVFQGRTRQHFYWLTQQMGEINTEIQTLNVKKKKLAEQATQAENL